MDSKTKTTKKGPVFLDDKVLSLRSFKNDAKIGTMSKEDKTNFKRSIEA